MANGMNTGAAGAGSAVQANREKRRKLMLEGNLVKVIPVIALPMIISMLIDSIYNMADTYFVSQLGRSATAAVGVNDSLLHFMRSIALGFGMGASSYISRLMGAKEEEEACRVGTTTLFTSMITLSVIAAVSYLFLSPLMTLLGATESVKPYSMDYGRFILLSAPFTAAEVAFSQILRSEGSTRYSMIGMLCGCGINIVLDPVFIHVMGLGVAGAAIATTISKGISFVVLFVPFLRKKTLIEIRLRYFTPKLSIYKEVAKMGIPTFLRSSMMTVASVGTDNGAGSFSDSALAAVSVVNKCCRLIGGAIMGFGQGFQPIAGYCYGAKRYKRVRDAFWTCTVMGMTACAILSVFMFLFSDQILSIFASDDREILQIGGLMLRSQCITLCLHVWVMIINGIFQALGKAIPAAVLGLSRQVICLIPCVVVMSALFGVNGLAVSQAAADVLSMGIALPLLIPLLNKLKKMPDGMTV